MPLTVAPWGGSTPPTGLHEKCFSWQEQQRGTHYVLLTHVALGMLHLRIYREGVRQYPILFYR